MEVPMDDTPIELRKAADLLQSKFKDYVILALDHENGHWCKASGDVSAYGMLSYQLRKIDHCWDHYLHNDEEG